MPRTAILFVICLILASCQSSKVAVDYDTQADFNQLQSYAWIPEVTEGKNQQDQDPLLTERAQQAISQQMPLQKSGSAQNTDVWVRYSLTSETKTEEPKTRGGIGIGSAGGSTGVGISLSLPLGKDKVIKTVRLVIDFINPDDQQLMWRGTNHINIGEDTPEEITQKVNKAVSEILARYPPQ